MAIAAAPIHRITVEHVEALEAAGLLEERRMELVDGILFDVVTPNPPHSHTVAFLTRHLARELPDHLELLVQDALFVHDGFLSPDLFVAPFRDLSERHHTALLAVEVTHTTHRRDRQKIAEYAQALVAEYWMVDLVARNVVVHRELEGDGYLEVESLTVGQLGIPGGGAPLDVRVLLAPAGT